MIHANIAPADRGAAIRSRIDQLQSEHHDLDCLIERIGAVPGVTDLELRRLKKRKLKVKDTLILMRLQLDTE
jgi:hypothetical protein